MVDDRIQLIRSPLKLTNLQYNKNHQKKKTLTTSTTQKMSSKMNNINQMYIQKQSSSSEYEQSLRVLISIIEQYDHSFHQMMDQHQDTIRDTPTFQSFINKLKNKSQGQIQSLYDGMKNMRKMLEEVIEKSTQVLPDILRQLQQSKSKIANIQQQLDDKDLILQGQKQKRAQIQKSLNQMTFLYQKSRHEYQQLSKQINSKQQQYQSQKIYIKKTFMEVTENNEMEKKILQEMYENNQKLGKTLNQTKNEKVVVEEQLIRITEQLTRTSSKVLKLEEQLQKKELKIQQYLTEIETIHNSQRKRSEYSNTSNKGSQQVEASEIQESFIQPTEQKKTASKTKLNEQLSNYKMPTVKQLNGSFIVGTAVRRSVGQYSDGQGQQIKKNRSQIQQKTQSKFPKPNNSTDPYFSHYILISQSVKIKQDCQDMLNIDMKPYYNEIVDKRIPMHLWDQWIKNRLRQLLRQSRA